MTSTFRAFALASTFVLASCGGGGGGGAAVTGGVTTGSPQAVTINETNAKPVSANALDTAQNTSATRGATGLPVGVEVDTGGATTLQLIAEAARFAATASGAGSLPTAVAVNQTVNCTLGGTMTVSGKVASSAGLSTGDTLSITTSNCGLSVGSTTMTLNGLLSMSVVSGSLTALPFHVVIATTATNLSVTTGGLTVVANGDTRLDWTANTATSQTLIASGSAMSSRETVNGATHTNTIRNYTQQLTINGTTLTGTLSATVETDSSRLGSGTVSYTISTPTPVVWNAATRTASSGVVKVVGANNSQLLLTVNANTSVTIQIDANGDGVYEKTITSTTAELAGLV